jgi:manganese transport system substrate-binding protein
MNRKLIFAVLALAAVILTFIIINRTDGPEQTASESDKIIALSTFTILSDMVSEVGGDKVEALSLTKPGAEVHGYQPTPSDLIQASKAQVIFENGLGFELWTEKLRASIPNVPVVTASEGVAIINITEDAYAGKPNPHAWMSPIQGLVYVENIRQALTDIAPEHADYFAANAAAYSERITAVASRLETALATLPEENRVLVTCEGAFPYLTTDYGLEPVYLWATNSDSQGTPQQVTRVIEIIKEKQVPAVFCESTVEPRIQQEVVAATNARLGGLLYVDSLSQADGPAPTYLTLLEHTVNTIISGLTETQ